MPETLTPAVPSAEALASFATAGEAPSLTVPAVRHGREADYFSTS